MTIKKGKEGEKMAAEVYVGFYNQQVLYNSTCSLSAGGKNTESTLRARPKRTGASARPLNPLSSQYIHRQNALPNHAHIQTRAHAQIPSVLQTGSGAETLQTRFWARTLQQEHY